MFHSFPLIRCFYLLLLDCLICHVLGFVVCSAYGITPAVGSVEPRLFPAVSLHVPLHAQGRVRFNMTVSIAGVDRIYFVVENVARSNIHMCDVCVFSIGKAIVADDSLPGCCLVALFQRPAAIGDVSWM